MESCSNTYEAPCPDNMDSIPKIKSKGSSLARSDFNRQNSFRISSRDYSSKRISVLETSKSYNMSHSGGMKIMNFIKSSLNLAKSKSKSKLNINGSQQLLYNQATSSKSDDHLNVLTDNNSYHFIKSSNLVLKAKDNILYVKEYTNNNELILKSLIVLNNQCLIQPLHSSLMNNQNFCFQITKYEPRINSTRQLNIDIGNSLPISQIAKSISFNSSFCSLKSELPGCNEIKMIQCSSSAEVDEWIMRLKKHINPNYENNIRNENLLQIWIQEAKQLIVKKRYYCEIKLDNTLYGRTTIKTMTDMVFWGEKFEFRGLQNINTVSICLFKMTDNKKKHDKSELVAQINIPCSEFTGSSYFEKWYSTSSDIKLSNTNSPSSQISKLSNSTKFNMDELMKTALDVAPMLRIKGRYRPLEILPTRFYESLSEFLVKQNIPLVESLESYLKVKSKEDFVKILLLILENKESHVDFLADLITLEVLKADDNLILRGNSIASKAMECYLKMVGEKYLASLLKELINDVILQKIDCEVDPLRLNNSKETSLILENQTKLLQLVDNVWIKIFNSSHLVPRDLKSIFVKIRKKLTETKRVSSCSSPMIDQVISSCLFLRFICPAIMSPFLFGLSNEYPDNVCINRTFTLIAKSIQSLANFSQYPQIKETYMEFMQNFVNKNSSNMRFFLKEISTANPNDKKSIATHNVFSSLSLNNSICLSTQDDRYIDIGYHFADLMFQLNMHLKAIPEKEYTETLINVKSVIENISKSTIHCEFNTDYRSRNSSNLSNSHSRIPTFVGKTDKINIVFNKSGPRIQFQNSNNPLSLVKQKSEIKENFSFLLTPNKESKEISEDKRNQINNDNYVDFEHCENVIYDEPYLDKSQYTTKFLNEEKINDEWYNILKEQQCNNISLNSQNSILEDPSNYTLNSSGYQTLANLSPDDLEKSIIQSQIHEYINIDNSNNMLASNLPVKLNSSKSSPIYQKMIFKQINKSSPLNKTRNSHGIIFSESDDNVCQTVDSDMPEVFIDSRETLESSENLSETDDHIIHESKSFQTLFQKNSGSNNNLIFFNRDRIVSESRDSTDCSLFSKSKIKSLSSQSFQKIISKNIDLNPLISNEWKRIKLLLKLLNIPKPSFYQGTVIEQYKQRTIDENCLEIFLQKRLQINHSDIINYLPAAYRLLKTVHKNGKISTELLTQYLIHANYRIQTVFMNQNLTEKCYDINVSKTSITKKLKNCKVHKNISNLSTQSLPFSVTKYSK